LLLLHTSIGTLELKAQKLEKAVEAFTNAIRYDPADFDANLNLGIAYYNLRKLDAAEAPLVNAAFIDRFAVTPHYYLGLVFSIKNNVDVAQKAFEKVKELNGERACRSFTNISGASTCTNN
jgi:tetratricopeptide (TPR) repeat protein